MGFIGVRRLRKQVDQSRCYTRSSVFFLEEFKEKEVVKVMFKKFFEVFDYEIPVEVL